MLLFDTKNKMRFKHHPRVSFVYIVYHSDLCATWRRSKNCKHKWRWIEKGTSTILFSRTNSIYYVSTKIVHKRKSFGPNIWTSLKWQNETFAKIFQRCRWHRRYFTNSRQIGFVKVNAIVAVFHRLHRIHRNGYIEQYTILLWSNHIYF